MAGAYPSHPPTSGAAPYQNSGYPNQTGAPPFQNSPYPTQANSGAPPYSVHGANTATPYPPMPHAYQQTNPVIKILFRPHFLVGVFHVKKVRFE
jgi:hypothetical protein